MKTRQGWIEYGVGYVPLTRSKIAKVDVEDLERVTKHNWFAIPARTGDYYAGTNLMVDGRFTTVLMHRFVLNAPKGIDVDHEEHDTLDNRKNGLRLDIEDRNSQNCKKYKNNTSGVKGVHFYKKSGRYGSYIQFKKVQKWLGFSSSLEEAIAKRVDAAKELFGEYAWEEGL